MFVVILAIFRYRAKLIQSRCTHATNGSGKTEVRTNPSSLLLFNFDIDGDSLKTEHKDFLRREAIPKIQAGASVSVIGLADRKASAAHNQALSERRVARTVEFLRSEVPSGFNLKQATGFGEEKAAQEGEKDETYDERFRAVLVFLSVAPVVTQNQVIEVTVKSFIALIGANVGSMPGMTILPPVPVPGIPIPVPVPVPRQKALEALAKATDAAFNEDPRNSAKDKHYRLFSSCRFTVVFEGGKILAAAPGIPNLDTDVGTEPSSGGFQPPPLMVSPLSVGPNGNSFVEFSWNGKGRPHLAVEPNFQVVKPRTSVYIWHAITGRIDVSSGTPKTTVALQGSQFPSHRVFVDGSIAAELQQGPFTNLWVPDPADGTKVK